MAGAFGLLAAAAALAMVGQCPATRHTFDRQGAQRREALVLLMTEQCQNQRPGPAAKAPRQSSVAPGTLQWGLTID